MRKSKRKTDWKWRAFQIVTSLGGAALCLIPTAVGAGLWTMANPEGFWQVLALIALLVMTLGGIQLWLVIMMIAWLVTVWTA